jgi:cytochrome c oxidase subunit 2
VNKKYALSPLPTTLFTRTIPAFGVKQDAIPGFVRDTWFKAEKIGVYRGQCVELCGKEHAFMLSL